MKPNPNWVPGDGTLPPPEREYYKATVIIDGTNRTRAPTEEEWARIEAYVRGIGVVPMFDPHPEIDGVGMVVFWPAKRYDLPS